MRERYQRMFEPWRVLGFGCAPVAQAMAWGSESRYKIALCETSEYCLNVDRNSLPQPVGWATDVRLPALNKNTESSRPQ